MKLYETLAEDIAQSIRTGVMKLGDKLPSVRETSISRSVSPSTVFEAYYLLEARGLIRSKERSGYYVIAGAKKLPPEPERVSSPASSSTEVDVSRLVFDILEASKMRDVAPFGSAFPSPLLFPFDKLASSMNASMRVMDPWSTVDDLTPGSIHLRRQIALRYLVSGMHVHTDDIIITSGALDALNLCLLAVTRPGDAVIIESPSFYGALQALERLGLRAIEVPTHPREGVDLNALANAIEQHQPKACWLMTNFQNPLGSQMSDEKSALVELITRYELPLIEDDVYAELYFGERRPLPAKAFDSKGLVMHCSSFSKSLAPGFRVGWAMPGRFTSAVARHKLTTTLSASVPAQEALADYLAKGQFDRHLRQLRHVLSVQQSAVIEAIARYFPAETKATRPGGGYFSWVELPAHGGCLSRTSLGIIGHSWANGFAQRHPNAHHYEHCCALDRPCDVGKIGVAM
jgi:DNA-binding transcriptional MocR family regulator